MLVLDRSPAHCNNKIIKEFEKSNTYYTFIPGGLTLYLQPLDVGINMPFKKALKKEYLLSKANILEQDIKISINLNDQRNRITNTISKIWWEN